MTGCCSSHFRVQCQRLELPFHSHISLSPHSPFHHSRAKSHLRKPRFAFKVQNSMSHNSAIVRDALHHRHPHPQHRQQARSTRFALACRSPRSSSPCTTASVSRPLEEPAPTDTSNATFPTLNLATTHSTSKKLPPRSDPTFDTHSPMQPSWSTNGNGRLR